MSYPTLGKLSLSLCLLTLLSLFSCSAKSTDSDHTTTAIDSIEWDAKWVLPELNGTPNMGVAGAYAGFVGNTMIVAGGANFPDALPWNGGTKTWWPTIYTLDTSNASSGWQISDIQLPGKWGYGASIQLPQGILCIGGCSPDKVLNDVFLITEKNGILTIDTGYPSLPQPLTNHTAALAGSIVYVSGGFADTTQKNAKGAFYKLDLNDIGGGWQELPTWPGEARGYAVSAAQSNGEEICYYMFGGRDTKTDQPTTIYTDGYVYIPSLNRWNRIEGSFPLMAGNAVAIGNHSILMLGGVPALLPANDDHPGFDNTIRIFDTSKSTMQALAASPYPIAVTTTAFIKNDTIYIGSGEVRPGVRTPIVLRGFLK